jgi:dihydrofolate reductase
VQITHIEMIVAVAENGVIGNQGDMPWRLPGDLAHFKEITMGCPVIMGRRTWSSIGRALPGRKNIVLSRQTTDPEPPLPPEVARVATPEAALALCADAPRVMIIGGGEIYRLFEAQAVRIHLTRVHAKPSGDTHFALAHPDLWHETEVSFRAAGEKDSADYSFVTLERKVS